MASKPPPDKDVGLDIFCYLHGEIFNYIRQLNISPVEQANKLHSIGSRVGLIIQEKLSLDIPRTQEEVDIIRFICRDVWSNLFYKQIDKLKTDKKGMYYLMDNDFYILRRVTDSSQYEHELPLFLEFFCGLLQGTLEQFCLNAQVTSDTSHPPACTFIVSIYPNK